MSSYLWVAFGGAIGSLLRYGLSWIITGGPTVNGFPWGVWWVNLVGCFSAGVFMEIFNQTSVSSDFKLFVFVGLLGGFTTFSAFSLESWRLFRDGSVGLAVLNIISSNFLCVFAVYAGWLLTRSAMFFLNR